MGSMQNFPPPRRSERGYSNDIDSRPNNRGLPRGRGRGGRGGGGGNSTGGGSSGAGGSRYHAGNNIAVSTAFVSGGQSVINDTAPLLPAVLSSMGNGRQVSTTTHSTTS